MTESEAKAVADALGGDARELPDGDWIVLLASDLNRIVVIQDGFICQYDSEDDIADSNPGVTLAIY